MHFWWKHVVLWYQILLKSSRVITTQELGGDVACLLIEDVGDVGLWPVFIVIEL